MNLRYISFLLLRFSFLLVLGVGCHCNAPKKHGSLLILYYHNLIRYDKSKGQSVTTILKDEPKHTTLGYILAKQHTTLGYTLAKRSLITVITTTLKLGPKQKYIYS